MSAWRKHGQVFTARGDRPWNRTHAAVPTADRVGDRWRIYYASRDEAQRSHTSFIEVDAADPGRVLYEHDRPVMPLGALGTFDDSGVMGSWVLDHAGAKYLYYVGWNTRQTVPFHNAVGLAVSHDGGRSFKRLGEGPILGLTLAEPYFTASCCVLVEPNGIWRMWYLSCVGWVVVAGRPEARYHLKYAESADGVAWKREGRVAIDFKDPAEGAIARPTVLRDADGYRMWYCYRDLDHRTATGRGYRIGYAESPDGLAWTRRDERAGIAASAQGWDAEMVCYPHVVRDSGGLTMWYNGNGFGRTGFGYARATEGEPA